MGLKFLATNIGDVESQWTGERTLNLKKLIDDAIRQAPCVLLLDEVNALLPRREALSKSPYNHNVVSSVDAMLPAIERARSGGVVLVAATNFFDQLDEAAIREGRFDFKIKVPMPDMEARTGILGRTLGSTLTAEGAIARVCSHWEGFSIARMIAIGKEARRLNNQGALSARDLMDAYLRVRGERSFGIPEDTPDLDQVVMTDDMRQRVTGLANRMKRMVEVEEMGGSVPRGVLFYGPAGTGKTLIGRVLAKASGWSFIPCKGPDLVANGDSIKDICEQAAAARPSIVFIDEAEDILMDRGISGNRMETNHLLAAIDGNDNRLKDVIFIAATNHPDLLDAAMVRGGRFGQKFEFTPPSRDHLRGHILTWMGKRNVAWGPDLELERVVDLLEGYSIANTEEVLSAAVNRAIDETGSSMIYQNHLMSAIADSRLEN